jgi:hypothetical protein
VGFLAVGHFYFRMRNIYGLRKTRQWRKEDENTKGIEDR